MSTASKRKDDVIQIRASAETKALLNEAAALRGQKLSEFMLESARQLAETTILEQHVFLLDAQHHEHLLTLLDKPPRPSKAVRARFARKSPWAR